MLFNSLSYGFFLPVVFVLYWLLPQKYRWILLLGASYYFYMSWNPNHIVLILFTTLTSYLAGLGIAASRSRRVQKAILLVSVFLSLSVLFFYKYFQFFSETLSALLQKFAIPLQPSTLKLLLPVGISFYTFQTIGYVADVYRGKTRPERHLGFYALFVSFFPLLVAGPIERAEHLISQLKKKRTFQYQQASYGIKWMAWGFFKKIVIADTMSVYVNQVYDNLPAYQGLSLVIATLFFAFQIYCDFSGYSDIAIGTAKLLGIDLIVNFKNPYFSASVKEFWSRWHISLSTWFRDYVYIPLGGSRVSRLRHAGNLMITFLISGLWHGANLTYLFWGALHGFLQILEGFLPWMKKDSPLWKNHALRALLSLITVPVTFFLVCLTWVFFRAATIQDGFYVLRHMFAGLGNLKNYLETASLQLAITDARLLFILLPLVPLFLFDFFSQKGDVIAAISRQRFFIRWPVYIALLLVILLFSEKGVETEFIYSQF